MTTPPTLRTLRIIFCVLILTLEVLGGMNSVVLTDVVQCIVTRTAHKIFGSSGSYSTQDFHGVSNVNFPMKAYGTAPSFRKEWGLEGTLETGTSPELGWPPCPTPKAAASGDDRLVPGRGWCPCGGVRIHSRDWTCRLFVPGKCLQECDRCLFSSCPLRRPKLRGGRLHCCGEARVLPVSKSIDTL